MSQAIGFARASSFAYLCSSLCGLPRVMPDKTILLLHRMHWWGSRPKVCRAVNMPGVIPFLLATVCMAFAARVLRGFNNSRLSKKKYHNSPGIVKVICCHSVSGSKARCFSIH